MSRILMVLPAADTWSRTAEVLLSEEARARFVEPNLSPIPRF